MVKNNSVVSVSYSLKNSKGEQLGEANEQSPLACIHGAGQIVPGLEKELDGMKVGDQKEVTATELEHGHVHEGDHDHH